MPANRGSPVEIAVEHYKDSIRSRTDLTPEQKRTAIVKYEETMKRRGVLTKDSALPPKPPDK